jgi:UrcA family protein
MNISLKFPMAVLTSALVASAFLLGDASAAEPQVSKSAQVSLAGIDLSTQAGVEAARERLHQAARKLCEDVADDLDLSHVSNFRKCVAQAMSVSNQHLDALLNTGNTLGTVASNVKQ